MRWRVRLTDGDPGRVFEADRADVLPGGALLLRNDAGFQPVTVRGYADGAWHVEPVPSSTEEVP